MVSDLWYDFFRSWFNLSMGMCFLARWFGWASMFLGFINRWYFIMDFSQPIVNNY